MDIPTVLGITWHKASAGDITILIAVLMVPVSIFMLVKIAQKIRDRRIHDEQLFLFKLKRLGLSNFQIKIINNLNEILGFSNPSRLFESPEFFEKAIGRFMTHARATGETVDSQFMMCRDLTVIYDKLYFHMRAKKPLKGIADIDDEQLVYFSPGGDRVYLGKITSRDGKNLFLSIFGNPGLLPSTSGDAPVVFHVYRVGDAVYDFSAAITGRAGQVLSIRIPDELVRREEVRHPFIDVIIPAFISRQVSPAPEPEQAPPEKTGGEEGPELPPETVRVLNEITDEKIPCTLYKLNDYEAVLRVMTRLDFNYRHVLEFEAMDFKFRIVATIIATKTVEEQGVMYYTVKFDEMSPGADNVLKKYVYEHL